MTKIVPSGLVGGTQTSGTIEEQIGVRKKQSKVGVTSSSLSIEEQQSKEVAAQEKFVREETAKVDKEITNFRNDIAGYSAKQKALGGTNRPKWNALDDDIAFAQRQIRGLEQGKKSITQGARFGDVTAYANARARAEIANLEAQQQAPSTKIDFSKIKQGEISYDSKSKLYYTRDSSGKLVVTGSGKSKGEARAVEYLQEGITKGGGVFIEPIKLSTKAPVQDSKDNFIVTGQIAGSMDLFQKKYISSLTSSKESNLEVQPYRGIQLPYGEKDIKWYEPTFGTATSETSKPYKQVSLFETLKSQEIFNPTISLPSEVIYQKAFGGDIHPITGKSIKQPTIKVKTYDPEKVLPEYKDIIIGLQTQDIVYKDGTSYWYDEKTGKIASQKGRRKKGFYDIPSIIKSTFDWGATETVKGGEWLGGLTQKTGVAKDSFLFKPLYLPTIPFIRKGGDVTREETTAVISSLGMWASFTPFFKTGTSSTQESVYTYDWRTGRHIKKADLKWYLEKPQVDVSGKTITVKKLGFSEKSARIAKLLRGAKDPASRVKILKFAEKTYGKSFMKDFVSQETGSYVRGTIKTKPTIDTGGYTFTPPPSMPRIDIIGATTQNIFQPTKTKQKTDNKILAITKSSQAMFQPSMSMSKTLQVSKTAQSTLQVSKTAQSTAQMSATLQIPKSISSFSIPSGSYSFPQLTPTKKGKIVPFGFMWPSLELPLQKKKKGGFIPQVMHKGKWKTVGKSMDRNSALSRASKGADLTTSRRMRIKPTNKPAKTTGISGWGMRQHKFRPYKIKKGKKVKLQNSFIEKTSYAIDTPTEKSGLNIAKMSKNMGWLKPTKKTKKTKTNSLWLKTTKNKRTLKKNPWLI